MQKMQKCKKNKKYKSTKIKFQGPKKLQFLSIFFENFEKIKLINLGYVR